MKIEIVKDKGFQLLVRLFKTAVRDGEIDTDEGKILTKTDSNMSKLHQYVNRAWEDDILDEGEKASILTLLQRIQLDAESIALSDNKITQEEAEMLSVIDIMLEGFIIDQLSENY